MVCNGDGEYNSSPVCMDSKDATIYGNSAHWCIGFLSDRSLSLFDLEPSSTLRDRRTMIGTKSMQRPKRRRPGLGELGLRIFVQRPLLPFLPYFCHFSHPVFQHIPADHTCSTWLCVTAPWTCWTSCRRCCWRWRGQPLGCGQIASDFLRHMRCIITV